MNQIVWFVADNPNAGFAERLWLRNVKTACGHGGSGRAGACFREGAPPEALDITALLIAI